VDAHAHINSEFYPDNSDVSTPTRVRSGQAVGASWREVLARALERKIAVVNIGTNREDSEENVRIAEEFSAGGGQGGVFAAVGLHPTETEEFNYEFYRKLAENKKVVAIGECGLDYNKFKNQSASWRTKIKINEGEFLIEKERQILVFKSQIRLAKDVEKPLMLHLRTEEAYADAINILEEDRKRVPAVIFHFYSGTKEQTEKLLGWGNFYVTVGGVITFSRDYDEVLKMIPMERMMVETDSPFVTPEPYRSQLRREYPDASTVGVNSDVTVGVNGRSKLNEPAYIVETVKKLAEIKEVSEEEMARITTETAKRVLGLV